MRDSLSDEDFRRALEVLVEHERLASQYCREDYWKALMLIRYPSTFARYFPSATAHDKARLIARYHDRLPERLP